MDKLYIVIPAYNERETIGAVIDEWYPIVEKIGEDSRLVIINDGSKDDTYDILTKQAAEKPQLVALDKPNGGHGATVLYGYRYALEQGADYVFQTDSDGQTLASEFEQFWRVRSDHDLNIGYRNHREDGFSRIIVTKTLKAVCRICFHVRLLDANTPYRLMSAQTLKENIALIPDDFNLSNVILTVIYARKKQKINYMPITFRPRQGGVNSINIKKIIKIGLKAVRDFKAINRSFKTNGI